MACGISCIVWEVWIHDGEMGMVMSKIYLRVFVQNHAQDLPDDSVAKTEFLNTLPHFSDNAVYGGTFGTKNSSASKPAPNDDDPPLRRPKGPRREGPKGKGKGDDP